MTNFTLVFTHFFVKNIGRKRKKCKAEETE